MSITYTIIGDPIPLARPRYSGPGRIVYDSQKLIKHSLLNQLEEQHGQRPQYKGPCHLDVIFYMKIPKTGVVRARALENKPFPSRPDLDNLIKMLCDLISMSVEGAGGLMLHDDSIITSITAKKLYGAVPRTVFTLTELT
jgi:Holliday junction resolvase RusA-like endonuclease